MTTVQKSDFQLFDFRGNDVRVLPDDSGNEWWVAADVCRCLDLSNTSKTVQRLDEDEKTTLTVSYPGAPPTTFLLINEKGLYRLIFTSTKEQAKAFQDWVFGEVLPAIRRTGRYEHPAAQASGNLATLANVSQQLAGVVTDHEQRLAKVERELEERKALPAPELDIDVVRKRFAGALREAIADSGVTDDMNKAERAAFHHGINSKLKNLVMCGRSRSNWEIEHYQLAADYLLVRHDWDLFWIFDTGRNAA